MCGISKRLGLSGLTLNPTHVGPPGCSVLAKLVSFVILLLQISNHLSNTAVLKREMLVPSVQGSC